MAQVPQVSPINYRDRLRRAFGLLGDGALLVSSSSGSQKYGSVGAPFRQDSLFHYLTGFEEPECALLLLGKVGTAGQSWVFLRDKDPVSELWEGRRLGVAKAKLTLDIDAVAPIGELWERLPALLSDSDRLFYRLGRDNEEDRQLIAALMVHRKKKGRSVATTLPVYDTDEVSGPLRLRKEPVEIERMQGAATITRNTFAKLYSSVRPGMNEREVYGMILQEFLMGGSEMQAYGAIVAGGKNACILHYKENSMPLKDGDLLLIDAGSQFRYYASDVTRTFPIGKKFSAEQRALYDIVLEAQMIGIEYAKPGSNLDSIHEATTTVITDGLIDVGLIKESRAAAIEQKLFFKYFPHKTSHWIGMDVHDVGDYFVNGKPRSFESGMYFSVEPGIYVDPDDESAPVGFRGIGIRIEDDVLITASGNEVLTGGIAKRPGELEMRN